MQFVLNVGRKVEFIVTGLMVAFVRGTDGVNVLALTLKPFLHVWVVNGLDGSYAIVTLAPLLLFACLLAGLELIGAGLKVIMSKIGYLEGNVMNSVSVLIISRVKF